MSKSPKLQADIALIKALSEPCHYERVMLKGTWANGDLTKYVQDMVRGREILLYAPSPLRTLTPRSQTETVTDEDVQIMFFRAKRFEAGSYKVIGSFRPSTAESWVDVGRIN